MKRERGDLAEDLGRDAPERRQAAARSSLSPFSVTYCSSAIADCVVVVVVTLLDVYQYATPPAGAPRAKKAAKPVLSCLRRVLSWQWTGEQYKRAKNNIDSIAYSRPQRLELPPTAGLELLGLALRDRDRRRRKARQFGDLDAEGLRAGPVRDLVQER
jgi:hypothetical protein